MIQAQARSVPVPLRSLLALPALDMSTESGGWTPNQPGRAGTEGGMCSWRSPQTSPGSGRNATRLVAEQKAMEKMMLSGVLKVVEERRRVRVGRREWAEAQAWRSLRSRRTTTCLGGLAAGI